MLNYAKIKKFFSEHKEKGVLVVCFILMFFVGFGAGLYEKQERKPGPVQANYTTKSAPKPVVDTAKVQDKPEVGGAETTTAAVFSEGKCLIKGNISGQKKIYHMPGGAFYARTKPERCFYTEAEAREAGFVKSSR